MNLWLLLIIGIAIIAGLGWYAVNLLLQLKRQQEQIARQEEIQRAKVEARNNNLAESINTIAAAMSQGQCDYSEGTIRICVLLDHLSMEPAVDFRQEYPQMHSFYDQIKHMATHDKRMALSAKERMKQDVERLKYEAASKEGIDEELPKLKTFMLEMK